MEIVLKKSKLAQNVSQWAEHTHQSVEDVVEAAVEAYLADLEATSLQRDAEVFWNKLNEWRQIYPGQYVAIHQGEPVDHDEDLKALTLRVRQRFGRLPVLIASVDSPPPREIYWRSPHR